MRVPVVRGRFTWSAVLVVHGPARHLQAEMQYHATDCSCRNDSLLASRASINDVAARANVDGRRSTVYRKLENPEFRDRLIGTALGDIAGNMTRAADALAVVLDAPQPHIRLRAIRALFTLGIRLRDSVDPTARMHDIERTLAGRYEVGP
jgi:hypothetical protein